MWYHYTKIILAKTREEHLRELGVSENVIDFINDPVNLVNIKPYLAAINKNPRITVQELDDLPVKNKETNKELEGIIKEFNDEFFKRKTTQSPEDVIFERWLFSQIGKNIRRQFLEKRNDIYYGAEWNEIYEWLDFYRDEKRRNPNFNISNFDMQHLKEMSEEWHQVNAGMGSGKMYEPVDKNNIVFKYDEPKNWTIQKVTSENDLLTEGNLMNHCVGSYFYDVERGRKRIFSLRDEKNKPKATIALDGFKNTVLEIQANSNSEPDQTIKSVIGEWLKTLPDVGRNNNYEIEEELSNLDYIDQAHLDDELIKILEKTATGLDDYGLPNNSEKNIEPFYSKILSKFSRSYNRSRTWILCLRDVASSIAQYALIFDIDELKKYLSKGITISDDIWREESSVEFLIEKGFSDFYQLFERWDDSSYRYDIEENEPDPEDYAGGEEDSEYIKDLESHEQKVQEHIDYWRDQEIKEYIGDNMPYALNESIMDYINNGKEKAHYDALVKQIVKD
jgi:hypothetical protein